MSFLNDHPRLRWIAPVAAVGLIGATSVVTSSASADSGLPPRTAAQLLADVQQARLDSLSGTIVQTSDLGLPELPGVGSTASGGGGSSSLTSMLSGTHTWRVWYAGPTTSRLALIGSLGESDVIRNDKDVWVWSSKDKTATHYTLSSDAASQKPVPASPTDLPRTPGEAARKALEAVDPSTEVSTSGTGVVAGRPVYELVLKPRDASSRVAQVRIAVDGERHIPLRVQVYSTKIVNPAFEVGFTSVDFAKPDARQFQFDPPPGTTVTESTQGAPARPPGPSAPGRPGAPKVVGTGWAAVLVAPVPAALTGSATGSATGSPAAPNPPGANRAPEARQLEGILGAIPKTSGSWGSGRLVDGTLFSAVLTDDGRVAVGAVAPERLYAALAAK